MNKVFLWMLIVILLGVIVIYGSNHEKTRLVYSGQTNSTTGIVAPEGSYSFEIANGSKVEYTALKRVFNKPEEYVTGSTNQVLGSGWFDPSNNSGYVKAHIDFTTIETDDKTRDAHLQDLFTDHNIIFSGDIALDSSIGLNEPFEAEVPGQITINSITKDTVFFVTGVISEKEIKSQGSAVIKMTDFGINPPSLVNVSTVDDNLELKFDITAKRIN